MRTQPAARPIVALFLACSSFLVSVPRATADDVASPWVAGFNNKSRLLAGLADARGGKLYAGVQIDMPAGWKTYWRAPGDAGGVPPEFDFSASKNLGSARVLYPAPHRSVDKAGTTIGYKDRVTFPVELIATDPSQPVGLKLKAAYGVCKDICIPAEAELELMVPIDISTSAEIAAALQSIPRTILDPATDPQLSAWRIESRDGKPALILETLDPAGADGDAFVDADAGLYLPPPKKISSTDGRAVYEVDLTDGVDIKDLKTKPIKVTLVGGKGQSETSITLP